MGCYSSDKGRAAVEEAEQLRRERTFLLQLDDAKRGLADIRAGRTYEADSAIAHLQQLRTLRNGDANADRSSR